MEDIQNKQPPIRTLLGVIAFIILCIIGFIMTQEYTLQNGQEVYLETMPVDPRDPLRGDFVILNYEIERSNIVQELKKSRNLQEGDTMYLSLIVDKQGVASVSGASVLSPQSGLFIRGKMGRWNSVDLGIGKYFVPEGTGKEIEKIRSDMQVLTAIDKYGTAKIKSLHYQGQKINPDTFIAP